MGIQKYGLETFIDGFMQLQKGQGASKFRTEQESGKEPSGSSETNEKSSALPEDNTMVTGFDLTPYIQSLNIELPNIVSSTKKLDSATAFGGASVSGSANDSTSGGQSTRKPFHHTLETLASPWMETSRSEVEPRFHTPKSFTNITGVLGTPGQPQFNEVSNAEQNKVSLLQDETLFFLFYKHPTSAVQELTYIELRKRNWRYHKLLKVWLTKDPNMEPIVQPDGLSERGRYIFFDPTKWEKCQREFILQYTAIM